MSYTVSVLSTVLFLSGVIAYIGDLLGRRMGKKRLSLFGLRPRHTAIILTILTGMAIAGGTLLFLSALEANVKVMLTQVPQLRREKMALQNSVEELRKLNQTFIQSNRELTKSAADLMQQKVKIQAQSKVELAAIHKQLQTERDRLLNVRNELRSARVEMSLLIHRNNQLEEEKDVIKQERDQIARARDDILEAKSKAEGDLRYVQTQLKEAQKARETAQKLSGELTGQNHKLSVEIRSKSAELDGLKTEIAQITKDLEDKKNQIRKAEDIVVARTKEVITLEKMLSTYRTGLESRLSGNIIFRQDEEMVRGVIPGGMSKEETGRRVINLFREASKLSASCGAQTGENGFAVAILPKRIVTTDSGQEPRIYTEQDSLEAVTEEIMQRTGSTLVRVVCRLNAIEGDQVAADFKLDDNRMIFSKGKEIAQIEIEGTLPDARIMQELVRFLQEKVRAQALKSGLIPTSAQTVGEISYDKLFEVLNRIKTIGRAAQVRATAGQDIWTGGPLTVDFQVTRVASAHNG